MDNKILPARVEDLLLQCERTSSPKFLGFLTPAEASVVVSCLKNTDRYILFGGYEGAERTMLCVRPQWCEDCNMPIVAVTFLYRRCDALSHSDFLGALMALGINRETVGDILIESGRAVAFVHSDVADFVLSQITKIGSVGVELKKGCDLPLPNAAKTQPASDTVASLRIDCVVSALCGFSRSAAADAISDGFVAVNSVAVTKPTYLVKCGDTVTVRQKGRFKITACDECSKKGRIILKYDKYI